MEMATILSWSPPFGLAPLNALHAALLRADSLDPTGAGLWLVACGPLLPQAYLLLAANTRRHRAELGALGCALISNAWLRFRFVDPADNAFNTFLTAAALFLIVRYIQWSLLPGPVVNPWMPPAHGTRRRLLAVLDMTIDVRGAFTPPDAHNGSDRPGPSSDVDSDRSLAPSPTVAAHLPQPSRRPVGRLASVQRHVLKVALRLLAIDTLYAHLHSFAHDTLQRPGGMPGALATFADRIGIRVLPRLLPDARLPRCVVVLLAELALPLLVMLWIEAVYHAVAAVAVGSTLWPAAAWDVDMFDTPLAATSVIDFWGRRWHQVLRNTFIALATATLRVLGIPRTSLSVVLFSFFASAAFHVTAHLAMDPVPASTSILAFFSLSGAACVVEVLFRRATGRRVHGWAGRLWASVFLATTGRLAADAWYDAGFAAAFRWPPAAAAGAWARAGPGAVLARWLSAWVYTPFRYAG